MDLRRARNAAGLQELQDSLIQETEASLKGKLFKFTPEQKSVYTTVGGTPFLDGGYSVLARSFLEWMWSTRFNASRQRATTDLRKMSKS